MAVDLGRISGSLLSANLLRQGVDLAFETDLLYIDVNTGRIGINTDGPTRDLLISNNAKTTNLIVDTQFDVPDFIIANNRIQHFDDTIYIQPNQLLDPKIVTARIGTLNLNISDKLIENISNDSNIELSPNGVGKVIFDTDLLNITGNLHSTNNITADGSVIFGNTDTDNTFFNADVKSDLIPNTSNQFDLGSNLQQWGNLYTRNIKSSLITSDSITVNNINLVLPQGKIIYVAISGSDTNYGTHQHSPLQTIKKALLIAQPGDQVFIYSGTYQEEFPLLIPQGVSVSGENIRSVIVKPTLLTNTQDAFLLNGETTVENLTVSDFYYNSIYNTGYAFRFAENISITYRSPYIRNCSVITKGSSILESDPLGFNSAAAGRGALVDGSIVNETSKEASMLFHSVTFIVPNADGITATNGARVEWLNSFTYYANRGIYLTEGTLGFASLGVKFGAEMRSINSANVYGNYGAVADGIHTLAYLIGHNFGYIGTGADSTNDPRLVIQSNEVEELNSGKIYYDGVDHKGNYRIGSIFYVNQETGNVTFDASAINFGSGGSIVLEGPSTSTIINNLLVQTGNIRVHDNNIDSLSGPTNFNSSSGKTYLNTNVFVSGNTAVTGDTKVSGDLFLGNDNSDVIVIAPELSQDINPGITDFYTLGTTLKRWNTLYSTLVDIDGDIQIDNNTLSTISTDTDLKFVAAGTGKIFVPSDNAVIDQNLTISKTVTINGTSSLKNTEVLGNILITGNINQTGDISITGTFSNNNIKITGNSYLEVPDIKIFNNEISVLAANTDLELRGNGTAGVIIDQKLKLVNNNISNTWASAISDLQKSIILSPSGTGNSVINTNKSLVVPVGSNSLRTLYQTGEIRYNSDFNTYEGYQPSGKVSFNNIFDTDKNTYITAELSPGANDNIIRFGINGTVKATITTTSLTTNTIDLGNIRFSSNNIGNLVSNNDVIFDPSSGILNVNNTLFSNNSITNTQNAPLILETTGSGYVKFAGNKAIVIPTGTSSERRLSPEIGEVRHNTTHQYMEVYSGIPEQGDNGWIPSTGVSGAATLDVVTELMDLWGLVLG